MELSVLIINTNRNPQIKKNLERFFTLNELDSRVEELMDVDELEQLYARLTPDLVFIDDDQIAIALSDKIRSLEQNSTIVLITDNKDINKDAYLNHLDGIIYRPLEEEAINTLVNTSIEKMKKTLKLYMFKYEGKMVIVPYKDIFYFKKQITGIKMFSKRGQFIFKESFRNLEETLDRSYFLRCHNNYIINIGKIASITGKSCRLQLVDYEIPVAGRYKSVIIDAWDKYRHI
ncbi:MAG TPA: hypothetical protein DCG34_10085 [Clostridiales bacterium]|jgi:two-component system LytT family response regulator/two-component system response regulator LytT|nr:hypothetical protein [Clostridiales bacterium]